MVKSDALTRALGSASQTRALEFGRGILNQTPQLFHQQFGGKAAMLVSDGPAFDAGGRIIHEAFQQSKLPCLEPFIFTDPKLYAEHKYVVQLESALKRHDAVAVAVGAGTINDLTKLASHRLGRPYLCVATAASMDGYTAFGASITFNGSKQTFTCAAPSAVLADLDVIAAAPAHMNSWGYADLLAKVTAGADWILADALHVEPIKPDAWEIIQQPLRQLVAQPGGARSGNADALAKLMEGLLLSGFAMQAAESSRAASGAEHQFSHLWDMQHHTHNGSAPSHGFKVGIGTLAVTALYEFILEQPINALNVNACVQKWPAENTLSATIRQVLPAQDLSEIALQESHAKWISPAALIEQLELLKTVWPVLMPRLRRQLIPLAELRRMLSEAGAPVEPEEIGITRERLRSTFLQAYLIRRRFTVLDVAVRCGLLEQALDHLLGPNGPWPVKRRDC